MSRFERKIDPVLAERERLLFEVTETIARLMVEEGVSRVELADRLGTSPAFITKALRGTNNFKLTTLCSIFAALGKSLHMAYAPLGDTTRIPDQDLRVADAYDASLGLPVDRNVSCAFTEVDLDPEHWPLAA